MEFLFFLFVVGIVVTFNVLSSLGSTKKKGGGTRTGGSSSSNSGEVDLFELLRQATATPQSDDEPGPAPSRPAPPPVRRALPTRQAVVERSIVIEEPEPVREEPPNEGIFDYEATTSQTYETSLDVAFPGMDAVGEVAVPTAWSGTHRRRHIVLQARSARNVRQGLLMREVLMRPRAFDL